MEEAMEPNAPGATITIPNSLTPEASTRTLGAKDWEILVEEGK